MRDGIYLIVFLFMFCVSSRGPTMTEVDKVGRKSMPCSHVNMANHVNNLNAEEIKDLKVKRHKKIFFLNQDCRRQPRPWFVFSELCVIKFWLRYLMCTMLMSFYFATVIFWFIHHVWERPKGTRHACLLDHLAICNNLVESHYSYYKDIISET